MTDQNTRLGILLMIVTVFIFAVQDGFARYLAAGYSVFMVIMVRYWFFAVFVTVQALMKPGGLRAAVRTRHPWLQLVRSVILIAEICVMVYAYTRIGLINTHAIFAVSPLLVAGLAMPILGEKVGWRRWTAIVIGMVGVAVLLQPDGGVFSIDSFLPLLGALLFALYSLMTRLTTRDEPAFISFFWSGIIGCVLMTAIGLPYLTTMPMFDLFILAVYSFLALFGHFLLIRSYSMAEASALQPFAYLQIVFITIIAITVFDEALRMNIVIGGGIVILAGLFTVIRSRQVNQGKGLRVGQR
jgi:drug/metabolite transporter (DMT)-like permease